MDRSDCCGDCIIKRKKQDIVQKRFQPIGECLNIDPTIIRLIWVVVTLCGGSGILAYIIAMVVMPRRVY